MKAQIPTNYHRDGEEPPRPFRSLFLDSVRYWESRRVIYNFALAAVSVGWAFLSATQSIRCVPLCALKLESNKHEFGARPVTGAPCGWVIFVALIAEMINSHFHSPTSVRQDLEFLSNRRALQSFGLQRTGI